MGKYYRQSTKCYSNYSNIQIDKITSNQKGIILRKNVKSHQKMALKGSLSQKQTREMIRF